MKCLKSSKGVVQSVDNIKKIADVGYLLTIAIHLAR